MKTISLFLLFCPLYLNAGIFPHPFDIEALDGSNGFRIDGDDAADFFGYFVSEAGDVNGDGIDDVFVGATRADLDDVSETGVVYVVFGKDVVNDGDFNPILAVTSLDGTNGFAIEGISDNDRTGIVHSSAGDINNDGFGDLVIGAPFRNTINGAVYVVYGKADFTNDAVIKLSQLIADDGFIISGGASHTLGLSVGQAGDINNDNIDDLIIRRSGRDYVIFGKEEPFALNFSVFGLDGTNGFWINGPGTATGIGPSTTYHKDLNGDDVNDLLLGYDGSPNNNDQVGALVVIYGHAGNFAPLIDTGTMNLDTGFTITGENLDHRLGISVDDIGDVNGDGMNDIIIGAPGVLIMWTRTLT